MQTTNPSVSNEPNDSNNTDESECITRTRYFTIINPPDFDSECICARTPRQAVSKAFMNICRKKKEDGKKIVSGKPIDISIQETTISSNLKIYNFEVKRLKLSEPQYLSIEKSDGTLDTKNMNYRLVIRKKM
jgi:hypothetical protein